MVMVLLVLAPELIQLLAGADYFPAINMSRVVIPMLLVVGVAQILSFQVLLPKGYDKYTFYASVVGAVIGIISNLILTTKFAAIGTCITVVITEVCVTSFYFFICIKKSLISVNIIQLFRKYFRGSIPYLFLCFIPKLICGSSILSVLGISFILCVIYFVLSQIYFFKNEFVMSLCRRIFK